MARIVITSFGSYGDTYPYVGLGLGLKARGHDAVLALPGWYRALVEGAGLAFHAVRPDVDPTDRALLAKIMDARTGTEFLVKSLLLPALNDSHADLTDAVRGADLLVTHPITFAGPIVAEMQGIGWASSVLAPMSFFSRHDLPVFPPAPGLKKLERVPGVASALVGMARAVTKRWIGPVLELRRALGLPPGGDPIYEGQHAPERVLALFSRVLAEPQPDWPPNVRITGQIAYNGPEAALPAEVSAFLDDGPAPIVFTLGSSAVAAAGRFYEESVKAARALGTRAILLVGTHAENRPSGVPEDILLVPSAPHALLFPRASAIVHQGGIGTLHQALRAGRPTVVVPYAHDQPDNAYRVERLGVSRTLPVSRYRARRVASEVGAVLTADYAARAAAVAERVRAEDGVTAACDAIEALLAPATKRR